MRDVAVEMDSIVGRRNKCTIEPHRIAKLQTEDQCVARKFYEALVSAAIPLACSQPT